MLVSGAEINEYLEPWLDDIEGLKMLLKVNDDGTNLESESDRESEGPSSLGSDMSDGESVGDEQPSDKDEQPSDKDEVMLSRDGELLDTPIAGSGGSAGGINNMITASSVPQRKRHYRTQNTAKQHAAFLFIVSQCMKIGIELAELMSYLV